MSGLDGLGSGVGELVSSVDAIQFVEFAADWVAVSLLASITGVPIVKLDVEFWKFGVVVVDGMLVVQFWTMGVAVLLIG